MPIRVGEINNGGHGYGIAVQSNYVYLANADDGLRVYDVSNPAVPINVGHINDGGGASAYSIALSGNRAYVANTGTLVDRMRIYDISNPTNPVYLGHTESGSQSAQGVAICGNYAYLASASSGLRVYDVSSPANPVLVGQINNGGNARGVAVAGHYACLANYDDGLRVYAVEPQVGIGIVSGGSLSFSWPAVAPFALQQSSDLIMPAWVTLTNLPAPIGSRDQLVLPAPDGAMFYRLISQ